jgi:putative intracellular protease/amidase
MKTRKIAIVFFEGFSTLDAYGPIQAFDLSCEPSDLNAAKIYEEAYAVAEAEFVANGTEIDENKLPERPGPNWDKPLYQCFSVGKDLGTVNSGVKRTSGSRTYYDGPATRIDYTFDDFMELHESIDIVLIPGAKDPPIDDKRFVNGINELAKRAKVVACVCTGSLLLAKSGYLKGKAATTNKSAFGATTELDADWNCLPKWVDCVDEISKEGWITSAGVSAGTDMACELIRNLNGRTVINNALQSLEYDWKESPMPDRFDYLCPLPTVEGE